MEKDGWTYCSTAIGFPKPVGDCRKIVTLRQGAVTWTGVRAFNHQTQRWMNGNEPEHLAEVIAWQDLPDVARGFWERGIFYLPE